MANDVVAHVEKMVRIASAARARKGQKSASSGDGGCKGGESGAGGRIVAPKPTQHTVNDKGERGLEAETTTTHTWQMRVAPRSGRVSEKAR